MMCERYPTPEGLPETLERANYVFTVAFTLEMALKLYALGAREYWAGARLTTPPTRPSILPWLLCSMILVSPVARFLFCIVHFQGSAFRPAQLGAGRPSSDEI